MSGTPYVPPGYVGVRDAVIKIARQRSKPSETDVRLVADVLGWLVRRRDCESGALETDDPFARPHKLSLQLTARSGLSESEILQRERSQIEGYKLLQEARKVVQDLLVLGRFVAMTITGEGTEIQITDRAFWRKDDAWNLLCYPDGPEQTGPSHLYVPIALVDAALAGSSATGTASDAPLKKRGGGRPPVYDWKFVKSKAMEWLQDEGEPPVGEQAIFEEYILSLFKGEEPAESTIRKHATEWLKEFKADKFGA